MATTNNLVNLTIRFFGEKDSPILERLRIVQDKLKQQGVCGGRELRCRIVVYGPDERQRQRAFKLYGITEIPTVVYSLGPEVRAKFEGSFTVATYFWQTLKILWPRDLRSVKKRKIREYEILKYRSKKIEQD